MTLLLAVNILLLPYRYSQEFCWDALCTGVDSCPNWTSWCGNYVDLWATGEFVAKYCCLARCDAFYHQITQIFVEEFTLQFMNFFFCEFMIRCSLAAEYIGICNFSWLLYGIASRVFCGKIRRVQKSIDSQKGGSGDTEEPYSPTAINRGPDFDTGIPTDKPLTFFDYFKYIWSTAVTLGSLVIVIYGVSKKAYVLPTPVVAAFLIAVCMLTALFYLEGLMIAIVGTQYWDPETFREVYPRAYKIHRMMSKPDNVKRFIIGRQFFTVLTNFLLSQTFTFANWQRGSYNPILFYIVIKSGLVGIFIILAFSQLLPELLAAQFPLRFMNMYGSYTISSISLVFDAIGVGHCAWAVYYVTRPICCKNHMEEGRATTDSKQTIVRVQSAEILAITGSNPKPNNINNGRSFQDDNSH